MSNAARNTQMQLHMASCAATICGSWNWVEAINCSSLPLRVNPLRWLKSVMWSATPIAALDHAPEPLSLSFGTGEAGPCFGSAGSTGSAGRMAAAAGATAAAAAAAGSKSGVGAARPGCDAQPYTGSALRPSCCC
eukprot:1139242-Pelagomonas_calceolata.AAC.1